MIKNNIFLFRMAFSILLLLAWSGCGTKSTLSPEAVVVCDKDADEALKNRNYEKSVILHEFYVKENPENGLAFYHLGFSYGLLGDHENEVKYYERAVSLGYYGLGVFFNLGMAYGEMEKFDDSVKIFQKAIEVDPERSDNHFGLALAYQKVDLDKLAEKEFKRAIDLDSKNIDPIYFLGLLYAETGRINKASRQLKKIIEIDSDNFMAFELKKIIEEKK